MTRGRKSRHRDLFGFFASNEWRKMILNSDRKAVNPAIATRFPAFSTRFRAMQHRNFQLFIAGQLISLIGTWMQTTAQLWLVYKLTGSASTFQSAK